MAHGGGAVFFPAHAGAFKALGDEAFAAGFDRTGADLPTIGAIARVIHPVLMVAEVLHLFTISFAAPATPAMGLELFPFGQERRASLVFQLMAPLLRECSRGRRIVRMTRSGERRDVFAGVKEVEHRRCQGEGFALKVFESIAGVADGELLLGRIPTDLSCLATQFQAERIQFI